MDRLQLHHVVTVQALRREKGDRHDPRNSLTVCVDCHAGHHAGGSGRLLLAALRDENYAFAAELLGAPAAFEYLRRYYAGFDRRHDRLLEDEQLGLEVAA